MDFGTDLIKLMPRRFWEVVAWQEFFQAAGEVLDDVHVKLDGLGDLQDPDAVQDSYLQYLADLLGMPLTDAPATTEVRRRWLLKSSVEIIKDKGLGQLMIDIATYLYLVEYPGMTMQIYELWSNDYVDFNANDLGLSFVPAGWVGDGATTTFATTLSTPPVREKSIRVTSVDVNGADLAVSDDGLGLLRGDQTAGSIVYATGVLTVTFDVAPGAAENVTAAYVVEDSQYKTPHFLMSFSINAYQLMGLSSECYTPSGWVGDGSEVNFAATIRNTAVVPGSIEITATDILGFTMTVYDDGGGELFGDVGSGVNTVDYDTGAIDLNFEAAVAAGGLVVICYQYYDVFLGRERHAALLALLERYRPAHTVRHVEFGQITDFWRVGDVHWRVGGPDSDVSLATSIRVGSSIWF